jgi:hypothetical protein
MRNLAYEHKSAQMRYSPSLKPIVNTMGHFTESVEVMQVCDLLLNGYTTTEIETKLKIPKQRVDEIYRILQDATAYEEG